jgi:UDP-N-acetylglucosamine--N-acetylmuramyl-(pentapeptide) pyrophosphoryl-undecaprenol N-acetylglucosamine transferase
MTNAHPRILLMAGGTGGHVYPGLAVARELQARGCAVAWLGTATGLEARLVPDANIELHCIAVRGLRGNGVLGWLRAPFAVSAAVVDAMRVLKNWRPDAVLGFGGFVAGPGGVAAWLLRKPLLIHEQNARPGLTNRLLARISSRVLQAFPNTFSTRAAAHQCGNPVRAEIARVPTYEAPTGAAPVRILVLGGSQGAAFLNTTLPQALARVNSEIDLDVRHQCGAAHANTTATSYGEASADVSIETYIGDMASAYEWAHLVIARAGAMTVTELAAAGRPSVLVPFPHAVDDHQTHNALYLVNKGAARCYQQRALDAQTLSEALLELLRMPQQLGCMAVAARSAHIPDADRYVADQCYEVAQ